MNESIDSVDQSSDECFHCGLPLPDAGVVRHTVAGEKREFCCSGCSTVCAAIHDAGLEGFYKRTPDGKLLAPPQELPPELEAYDLDEIQGDYVENLGAQREIHLLVEGIHCAACVWLIENSLRSLTGVLEAKVNLSGRKLLVRWNNEQLQLSRIIARVGEVGYKAVPFDPETARGALQQHRRDLLFRMGFAAFAMMNLLWISIALYTGAAEGEFRSLFHWIGFLLATPTLLYSGAPFYRGAWAGLRNLRPGMDLPIAIGASITWGYSLYVTFTGVGEVYWDTVVNFLFVILLGRYLESLSKASAVESTQRLFDLQPRVATVVEEGEERLRPIRAVRKGDFVRVKPGQRIPVDGVVEDGKGEVDESMLSGESMPVLRVPGEQVAAGTVNLNGVLLVRVTGALSESTLGKIIRLVEEAQASKAPVQCMADRIVPWFVLITISLALVTFLFWVGDDFAMALMAATSVLIITCPCAFGLATPMAIAVAAGHGARLGVLVKNGEVLEILSQVKHMVFDKTGTLTLGRMSLDFAGLRDGDLRRLPEPASKTLQERMQRVAALEALSEHPVAKAIVRLVEQKPTRGVPEVRDFIYQPGFGVRGRVDGEELVLGTSAWLNECGVAAMAERADWVHALEQQGATPIHCAFDGQEMLLLGVRDQLRQDAKTTIDALREMDVQITLLSGDRKEVANAVARDLGGMDVVAEVRPEEKSQVIGELQQREPVAMVGDGVNDAPALVKAAVGIAMGSGTDVSISSADIVLVGSEIGRVRMAVALARRTLRTIYQNIGISITYNIIMVPLAMAGMVTPLVAAFSMPISSLLVIGNAARIKRLFSD